MQYYSNVGPEVTWNLEKRRDTSYGASTDYIFAYQLMRMKPKKGGEESKSQSFVKGAMFGKVDEGYAAEIRVRDVFYIEEEISLGIPGTWEQVEEDEV
ncbi:hypothetical protein ACO1O0_003659 [Amphichorda felina]